MTNLIASDSGIQFNADGTLNFDSVAPIMNVASPELEDDTDLLSEYKGYTFVFIGVEWKDTNYGKMPIMTCLDKQGQEFRLRSTSAAIIRQMETVQEKNAFPVIATIKENASKNGPFYTLV